ncbi:MAG TPA: diguanylate cyclase [Gaiellaceae bacterium]|nr:diguanylate cyclase [Gaiellaceae bacterium]
MPQGWDQPGLPGRAMAYLLVVLTAAGALAAHLLLRLHDGDLSGDQLATFALLATAAAITQLFVVITPRNQSYHTTIVFLIPAALLLPPALLPLVALVQHVPEWLKERYAWYIQSFNIANYALNLLAAAAGAHAVLRASWLISDDRLRSAAAWIVAAVVLVAANHVLLALMLRLGRGHSWRASGLFTFESLSTDLVLGALGITLTVTSHANLWLVGLALAPLLLIHRSLAVPALEAEARIDPKTGLFNVRHFTAAVEDELERARRMERPLSLLMVDLDLLREINNSYGHLAGDAVLEGIAGIFRKELRHYDVPARFGGEEFSILLPETERETALEIAERIRRSVAQSRFSVETSNEPITATISIGVAAFPRDGTSRNELIHNADVAVYRAKLQGRNRVLGASAEPLLIPEERRTRLVSLASVNQRRAPTERASQTIPHEERRRPPAHQVRPSRELFPCSGRLAALVGLVGIVGTAAGAAGILFGHNRDLLGMLAIAMLAGVGQALALEVPDGSISVGAVGALAGAALFGPRIALALAVTTAVVDWSARRPPFYRLVFNVGALSIASLSAVGVFELFRWGGLGVVAAGVVAGIAYFGTNTGLLGFALALEDGGRWWTGWWDRFSWLLPHYLVYGLIGGVIAVGYDEVGLYAFLVFAMPLLLIRKTQEAYLAHTRRSVEKLRDAAETIQRQNVSLEQANQLLRERSMAAMESLAATVDARDSYTAGHSRRVQRLALLVGRELGLPRAELEVLGQAALFHDIGKLAIPDAILLKPGVLTEEEWGRMRAHAEEGARIIDRLGFLRDAVPAIQHHHERWDGSGYPAGLAGNEIPLGARIIHVVDALDSMLTSRLYRAGRPLDEAMLELRAGAATQFCPHCVEALERVLAEERARGYDTASIASEFAVLDQALHKPASFEQDPRGRSTAIAS